MSIQPPQGILNIPNATLRVGKLAVDSTAGFDTVFNNVERNTILLEDSTEYTETKQWDLKMPNIFVATFEIKGGGSSFNFRNTSNGDATTGYTLTFSGTTLTLKYDNASLTTATIPNLDSVYRKVYVTFEKQHFTVTVDGTLVLTYKDATTRTPPEGEYANFFKGTGSPGFKNLKVVAGHFISDGTSNVSLFGGLAVTSNLEVGQANLFVDTLNTRVGVGTTEPKESLDVVGNMHLTRVSNVSQIKVDSNVVTEYTGPHDRPLRKYPEVAILGGQSGLSGGYTQDGYTVEASSEFSAIHAASNVFNHIQAYQTTDHAWLSGTNTYGLTDGLASSGTSKDTFQDVDGSWLGITLPTGIRLSHIHIYNRFDNANSVRPPKTGIIWASNDGTSWYNIFNFDNLQDTDGTLNVLHVNNTNFYTRYRVQITAMHNDPQKTSVAVGELEFYGHEEGSGSLDTTLKSVYNVPATTGTQLEVYYDAKDLTTMPSAVTDLSPNTNDGSVSGDPQVSNGAFVFDGVNDYIYNSQSGYTSGNTYTGSAWIKKTSNTNGCVFQFGNGSNGNSFGIFYYGGTIDYVRAYVFGYALANSNSGSIPLNEWIHVTGVYSGKTATLYINGIEVATNTGSTDITIPSTPYLTIGAQTDNTNTPYTGTYFTGSIANFRLYSKALNADQVKELYEYQKDYFLGSKSQVTLYKGHLGVGVTEPSGQLELAGDERIQEYPPGPMDDYDTNIPGHGVFKVYASTDGAIVSGYAAWKAFNDVVDGLGWHDDGSPYTNGVYTGTQSLAGTKGEWIALKLPYAINLKSAATAPRSGHSLTTRGVGAGVILGSNDGNNWDQLHSFSGLTATDYMFTYINNITAPGYYTTFALLVTELAGSDVSLNISEIKFFGTPGPTTLDKGSLTLGRSLDVPRISRYDVDTETPRPEKLVVDYDTTVNSSPTDISGQGNHGVFYNDAYYSAAEKAFVFDGTGDYIQGNLNNTGDTDFTVSCWFKRTADAGSECVWFIGGESTSNPGNGVGLEMMTLSDGSGYFFFYSGYEIDDTDLATVIGLNKWVHLVCTRVGNTMKIYLNGEDRNKPVTGTAHGLSLDANTEFRIGQRNSSGTNPAHGMVSNFKIYNVVLEPSEVKKLYNLGRTGRSMVISDTAVGIGKVPEAQLDVRGTLRSDGLTVGGDIYATGNITGYSDRRAKSDIEKIENALEKIEQLNGYTFTMKGKRYTGLIAQEILPILPEAVSGSEETNYAVAYGNMMGLIVEAIKELKQKIG
jgi:hypothetical protein